MFVQYIMILLLYKTKYSKLISINLCLCDNLIFSGNFLYYKRNYLKIFHIVCIITIIQRKLVTKIIENIFILFLVNSIFVFHSNSKTKYKYTILY